MARGRMISKAISLDEKVDGLSDDTARLLFTWMIPHLDREGRIYGEARVFRSIVAPRRNYSIGKVEKVLTELEKTGLIERYSINGNAYISVPNFEKHQTGLRKDKESPSQIPPNTPDKRRSKDGVTPPQVKVKVKVKDNSIDLDNKKDDKILLGEFENVILSAEEVNKLLNRFGEKRTNELIETLSAGIESKGYNYKSHYAAILNWAKRDGNKEPTGKDSNGRDTDKYIKGAYGHCVQR